MCGGGSAQDAARSDMPRSSAAQPRAYAGSTDTAFAYTASVTSCGAVTCNASLQHLWQRMSALEPDQKPDAKMGHVNLKHDIWRIAFTNNLCGTEIT